VRVVEAALQRAGVPYGTLQSPLEPPKTSATLPASWDPLPIILSII